MSEKGTKIRSRKKCEYNVCPEWVVDSLVLVHFGASKFQPELLRKPINEWVKPRGGLWTSPVGSDYGWEKWCRSEGFRIESLNECFFLKFKSNSKIAIIDSLDDLLKLPRFNRGEGFYGRVYLDFEIISNKFDAIWLTVKGQSETRFSSPMNLYGWDCESILVFNPESIQQQQRGGTLK